MLLLLFLVGAVSSHVTGLTAPITGPLMAIVFLVRTVSCNVAFLSAFETIHSTLSSHIVSSIASHIVSSTASHVVSSIASHVVTSIASHVVTSVASHVATSIASHVITSIATIIAIC